MYIAPLTLAYLRWLDQWLCAARKNVLDAELQVSLASLKSK